MTDEQAETATQETPKTKPKAKRAKRDTLILEKLKDCKIITYQVVLDGLESTAEADKWVKENGESLIGKTLRIVPVLREVGSARGPGGN